MCFKYLFYKWSACMLYSILMKFYGKYVSYQNVFKIKNVNCWLIAQKY